MKMKNKIRHGRLLIFGLSLTLILSGCGRKEADSYGQKMSGQPLTKVSDILKDPANFDGKTVTIQGKIISECPSGCWFDIQEETAVLYVDLYPSGFAIPQKTGKQVAVEGTVSVRDNKPMLTGKGVEIK
jgi:hypothetical protein